MDASDMIYLFMTDYLKIVIILRTTTDYYLALRTYEITGSINSYGKSLLSLMF